MSGDIFELLVALAIIFFGLLGGGRRKKRSPPSSERKAPARPSPSTARSTPSTARTPSGPGARAPTAEQPARDELFSEIERVLRGQVPEERPVPPPRAPEPEEAYSLEPLEGEPVEIDSEKRHQDFHQKYVRPRSVGPLPPATVASRAAARVQRIPLRQAVMWREILGPPKGLE